MADGTRTRDHRDHNPGLYQLSYRHRARTSYRRWSHSLRTVWRLCNTEPNGSVYYNHRPRFRSLTQPNSCAVLERLGAGSATISELAEPFGMSLTGMKKHIRLLEEAELVTTEKVGRARRCTIAPYAFEGISTWLQRLDRFAEVVQRTKGAR